MDKIGIIKEIDDLGRLQIPKEIRTRLGLDKEVELILTADGLLIRSRTHRLEGHPVGDDLFEVKYAPTLNKPL